MDNLVNNHIQIISKLIARVEKRSRDSVELANLDRLRKRISLLCQTMGPETIIVQMFPFMMDYKEAILQRNEDFFLGLNARAEYIKKSGKNPTNEEEFIFQLVDSIRGHYRQIPKEEKDEVYNEVLQLFNNCIKYKLTSQ